MWIKQLCNRKDRDYAMALRARKVSGAFEKRPPGRGHRVVFKTLNSHSTSPPTGLQMGTSPIPSHRGRSRNTPSHLMLQKLE